MTGHVRWQDVRARHIKRAGGEEAVAAGKRAFLAEVQGHPLAEIRRGLAQGDIAERTSSSDTRQHQAADFIS